MKLNILVTTDVHGNIFPTNYTSRDNVEPYGLARISTAIKEFRKNKHTLLIDNGDAFQGTPLLTYALAHRDQQKNPMAQAFNYLNYDYINLGNHDFNFGQDILFDFIEQNEAPLLTQNATYNNRPLGQTQIIEIEDKKIAILGVLTQYIPKWERDVNIEDMTFESAYLSVKESVEKIKNDVDYIIVCYHGGFERDLDSGEPTESLTGENEGFQMCYIDGVDILITGHQHRSIAQILNGVLVTQSAYKGQEFALIELDLQTGEKSASLVDASNYEPDQDLLDKFKPLQSLTQDWLDETVGTLEGGPILVTDAFEARLNKHPLVSLINQIQMHRTKAQLSAVSLFSDSRGFNQTITMRDVVSTYLYPNTLVLKKVSGHNIKQYLELSAEYFEIIDGKIGVNPSYDWPKPKHYNYDMMDGLDYTIKVSNTPGTRIMDMVFEGKPFDLDRDYTLAINNYRATGGGDFYMIKDSETIEDLPDEMVDILTQYLEDHPIVTVNHKDNIKVIV